MNLVNSAPEEAGLNILTVYLYVAVPLVVTTEQEAVPEREVAEPVSQCQLVS